MKKGFSILILVFLLTSLAKAQFEKKITFDFSLGYAIPLGEDLREDRLPHFFSNMNSGFAFTGDFQYNLNKKISVGLRGEYTDFWSWNDPRSSEFNDLDESWLTVVGFSPYVRYKLLDKKISPFLMLAAGVSTYSGERSPSQSIIKDFYTSSPEDQFVPINEVLIREPGLSLSTSVVPNTIGGLGVEMNVSQTIGAFVLGTYNLMYTNQDDILRQNIQYFIISGGVNVNFIKAKTL